MKRIIRIFSAIGDLCQILGTTVLILIIGHFVIGVVVPVQGRWNPDARNSPVYDNYPERAEFWVDHMREVAWTYQFEPYIHWRRVGFDGKYTSVGDNGVRYTTRLHNNEGAHKVFMLGGSTMWGFGTPDDKTIPSILQTLLGESYRVYNYGESGWVSTQELNYLLHQLSIGNIPDIVVFYDGVNDGYAGAYSPAIPRDPENLRADFKKEKDEKVRGLLSTILWKSNYGRLITHLTRKSGRAEWDREVASKIDDTAARVISMYEAHIKQVRALANEYGFKVYFFWQPNLFSLTRKMNEFERRVIDRASPVLVQSQQAVYDQAKQQLAGRESTGIYFLGDVFDDFAEPVYIDWHHLGPNGNEIIATEIYLHIKAAL